VALEECQRKKTPLSSKQQKSSAYPGDIRHNVCADRAHNSISQAEFVRMSHSQHCPAASMER
jgi:hypothetical protein